MIQKFHMLTPHKSASLYHTLMTLGQKKNPGFCVWLEKNASDVLWSEKQCLFWNEVYCSPHFPIMRLDGNVSEILYSLAKKKNGLLILSENRLLALPSMLSVFRKRIIPIMAGAVMKRFDLIAKLSECGFSRSMDGDAMSYAVRGETLTLYTPEHREGLKILFSESHIESLWDRATQKFLDRTEMYPKEFEYEPSEDTPSSMHEALFDEVSIFTHQRSINEEIRICIDNFARKSALTFYSSIATAGYEDTMIRPLRSGALPEMIKKLSRSFEILTDGNFSDTESRDFEKNLKLLQGDVGKKVFIISNESEMIRRLLPGSVVRNMVCVYSHDPHGMEGFLDQRNGSIFLPLFFKKKKARSQNISFLKNLSVGDYVVHEDHGIARFRGFHKVKIGEVEKENLYLEYAQGDKLFLPPDMTYKIDKYVGSARPSLSRLSSVHWHQVMKQVKEETEKFANELLELYAKRQNTQAPPMMAYDTEEDAFADTFPYEETDDQKKAIFDVFSDLGKTIPMDRLIVGDVGFGKTEIALRAAFRAVQNGFQVALLCPTTILAQQHYDTFFDRMDAFGVSVASLSRFSKKLEGSKAEKKIIDALRMGSIDIVVGTHRLLSSDIGFKKLGLVIIDEEQKFGVAAKEHLKRMKHQVHVLTLSATPIPRTLYFSMSGIRDISIITQPPAGRLPIETVIDVYEEEIVRSAIDYEMSRKGQVYYLSNDVKRIEDKARFLQSMLPAGLRIGILHGQLPEDAIASVMGKFDHGRIDILVCSTIIENGIDLPNVNTLIVENAQNFGLSQLHQIRGRIGRGTQRGKAYFLYAEGKVHGMAEKRLAALMEARKLGAGMDIATKDMEMRGMGNILGKRQHGNVTAVGLGMYLSLLENAVHELSTGRKKDILPDVSIDLPFEYMIPADVVSKSSERLALYARLGSQTSLADLEYEWKAAFKKRDDAGLALLKKLFQIKILAQRAVVLGIRYDKKQLELGRAPSSLTLVRNEASPEFLETIGWSCHHHKAKYILGKGLDNEKMLDILATFLHNNQILLEEKKTKELG